MEWLTSNYGIFNNDSFITILSALIDAKLIGLLHRCRGTGMYCQPFKKPCVEFRCVSHVPEGGAAYKGCRSG